MELHSPTIYSSLPLKRPFEEQAEHDYPSKRIALPNNDPIHTQQQTPLPSPGQAERFVPGTASPALTFASSLADSPLANLPDNRDPSGFQVPPPSSLFSSLVALPNVSTVYLAGGTLLPPIHLSSPGIEDGGLRQHFVLEQQPIQTPFPSHQSERPLSELGNQDLLFCAPITSLAHESEGVLLSSSSARSLGNATAPITSTIANAAFVKRTDKPIATSQSLQSRTIDDKSNPSLPVKTSKSVAAARAISHKKLTAPFRSPILSTNPNPTLPSTRQTAPPSQFKLATTSRVPLSLSPSKPKPRHDAIARLQPSDSQQRLRSKFKSPFKSPLKSSSNEALSSSSAPSKLHIKSLERELQLLKQALSIKQSEAEEQKLRDLVKKWRQVGRDAAWEVWATVKDQQSSSTWGLDVDDASGNSSFGQGQKGSNWGHESNGHRQGWGWDEDVKATAAGTDGDEDADIEPRSQHSLEIASSTTAASGSRFKDAAESHQGEEINSEPQEATMGLMLRQLGIAHGTLGWNEGDGDFEAE